MSRIPVRSVARITGYLIIAALILTGCGGNNTSVSPTESTSDRASFNPGIPGSTGEFVSPRTHRSDNRQAFVENEVLAVLTDQYEQIIGAAFFSEYPLDIIRKLECDWGTLYRLRITQPDDYSVVQMTGILDADERIRFAEPNYCLHFHEAPYWPNDPMWESDDPGDDPRDNPFEQWGPAKLGASVIWNESKGDDDIIVAIIDTGIRRTHEDLSDNIWTNDDEIADNGIDDDNNGWIDDTWGWDCFNNDNDPWDDQPFNYYHGTGCSGVVAAIQDNNKGISGIAPGVQLMAIKADMNDGPTCVATVVEAWDYAKTNEADICSMSFGVLYPTEILEIAAADTWDDGNGPILMASAGNDDNTNVHAPARYESVICVGATVPFSRWNNPVDERRIQKNWAGWWWGSTYGPLLNIMGFGEKYFSTYGSGDDQYWDGVNHWFFNGTSCACPTTAATMALIKTFHPGQTGQWYWDRIEDTADDLETPGFDNETGNGRVNTLRAVYGSDRYSEYEDPLGFVTIDYVKPDIDPPLFDSIHDRPGTPHHDTEDLYRIVPYCYGDMTIYLDIFTWGEDLDMALYSDDALTDLIASSTQENHAANSYESITTWVDKEEACYLKVYSAAEGDSTTYGLSIDYVENKFTLLGENLAPSMISQGEFEVPFIKLYLGIVYEATLDRITVHAQGNAHDWCTVKLFEDTNDNGNFDAGDLELDKSSLVYQDTFTFDDLDLHWTNAETLVLFVAADISTDAPLGSSVYLGLEDENDVELVEDIKPHNDPFPVKSINTIITS